VECLFNRFLYARLIQPRVGIPPVRISRLTPHSRWIKLPPVAGSPCGVAKLRGTRRGLQDFVQTQPKTKYSAAASPASRRRRRRRRQTGSTKTRRFETVSMTSRSMRSCCPPALVGGPHNPTPDAAALPSTLQVESLDQARADLSRINCSDKMHAP
jgi:hypothetical protein